MQFYGQFNPPVDKIIYEKYFSNPLKKNGICIEAGAFDGKYECSCFFFEESLGWKCYNIEPYPINFKNCVSNRPNSFNINKALSNIKGTAIFRQYEFPNYLGYANGNGSCNHVDAHKKRLEEVCGENNYHDIAVETFTYKDLIEQEKIEHIDLFVLDVEGFEIQVLEGMQECDILPGVFVIEFGHLSLDQIQKALDKLNAKYIFDFIHEANAHYHKI